MNITPPVAPGMAENLARIWHFRALAVQPDGTDQPDAGELDAVAYFLIGDVGGITHSAELWRQIADDCDDLWFLIADDWDECDLDDLTEAEWERSSFATHEQEIDARYVKTRERLAQQIEHAILVARWEATEAKRAAARRQHKADIEAAIHRHPAGSRLPAQLTGSERRGGGNPLGDYLHLKGEGR